MVITAGLGSIPPTRFHDFRYHGQDKGPAYQRRQSWCQAARKAAAEQASHEVSDVKSAAEALEEHNVESAVQAKLTFP